MKSEWVGERESKLSLVTLVCGWCQQEGHAGMIRHTMECDFVRKECGCGWSPLPRA